MIRTKLIHITSRYKKELEATLLREEKSTPRQTKKLKYRPDINISRKNRIQCAVVMGILQINTSAIPIARGIMRGIIRPSHDPATFARM
jgi:hypothetical protein